MKKVIICGGFYDAAAEQMLRDKVIVTDGRKIEQVLDKAAYTPIPGAELVDLSGR